MCQVPISKVYWNLNIIKLDVLLFVVCFHTLALTNKGNGAGTGNVYF